MTYFSKVQVGNDEYSIVLKKKCLLWQKLQLFIMYGNLQLVSENLTSKIEHPLLIQSLIAGASGYYPLVSSSSIRLIRSSMLSELILSRPRRSTMTGKARGVGASG